MPWSLATIDGLPVKTHIAKLLRLLEADIVPSDINALHQSFVSVPDTLEGLAESVFARLSNAEHFVTDSHHVDSFKSTERVRREIQRLSVSDPR
jgi:hypothetical protein